ncbi:fibronectin type III domain-containing protein [Candidatus Poribacteria bacterium]|nr:fibronectin type III domain-containing protein [Candidatus Poribacteria bacterium]
MYFKNMLNESALKIAFGQSIDGSATIFEKETDMREYECYPMGRPEEAEIVCLEDGEATVTDLEPNTRYVFIRAGNTIIKESNEDGEVRIGTGFNLGL